MHENWLYALAQCGASFVAIIGAFYTTKILSISSEKKRVMNTMDNLTSEIEGLEKLQPKGGARYGYDPKIDARIGALKAQRRLYERQLEGLLFPPHWKWGISSFVYFAVAGVILPLMVPLVSSEICLTQLWIVLAFYISGFIMMFTYLGIEIKNAILKD